MKEFESYYLYDTTQGSDDWLHMRKGRITMSNLGKVVGHCPFSKHKPEYLAKLLKGEEREEFSQEAIERMRKGNEYEPVRE